MNAVRLAALHVERLVLSGVTPVALGAGALVARSQVPRADDGLGEVLATLPTLGADAVFDASRAGWLVGGAVILFAVGARAARFGADWRERDALWLGAQPIARRTAAGAALAGIAAAGTLLALALAGLLAATAGTPDAPAELRATSGPAASLRLAPGGWLEHEFPAGAPGGATARVRVVPTVGAPSPTTRVALVTAAGTVEEAVARRTVLEVPLGEDAKTLRIENRGAGVAAVLGPAPFEVWTPSPAWLGGHVRMAAHLGVLALLLGAGALAAGLVLRPGIAGAFGAALVALPLALVPLGTDGGPLGATLGALGTLAVGRVPGLPSPGSLALALGAVVALWAVAGPALGRTPDGGAQ